MLAGTRWILSDRIETGEVDWLALVMDCQRLMKDRHWLSLVHKVTIFICRRDGCFLSKQLLYSL